MLKQKVIAANWKMQGDQHSLKTLSKAIADIQTSCALIVFPPYVFIPMVETILRNTCIQVGAQNTAAELVGAFTGEVSATMLYELGCRYVLLGHSERRQLFCESNDIVAKKFSAARQAKLLPILCVGETRYERDNGATVAVVLHQIEVVIALVGIKALQYSMLAYEPIWAIGTGLSASPEQAQAVHVKIREHLAKIDAKIAASIKILYGGSVNANNAAALFAMPDIDGGLVGGAALDLTAFSKICQAG